MKFFAPQVENLIENFAKLPGIGNKTAERLAYHVINMDYDDVKKFSNALIVAKENIKLCKICQNITDTEICEVCSDKTRDKSVICVVSEPKDVIAFEKTREFKGTYHVLHGAISPSSNVGPDDIKLKELLSRLTDENIAEIIVATNPDTSGEATSMYLSRLLKPFEIKVSRLAFGLPVGTNLEYVDEITLMRALDGRREI